MDALCHHLEEKITNEGRFLDPSVVRRPLCGIFNENVPSALRHLSIRTLGGVVGWLKETWPCWRK